MAARRRFAGPAAVGYRSLCARRAANLGPHRANRIPCLANAARPDETRHRSPGVSFACASFAVKDGLTRNGVLERLMMGLHFRSPRASRELARAGMINAGTAGTA